MADITLTSAVRGSLLSLQNTSDLINRTQSRLSTGLKVQSAIDDPVAFFQAKGLSDRAGDFTERKESIDQGISSLTAANDAVEGVDSLVRQLKGIANSLKSATAAQGSDLVSQYNELRGQINELAADSQYQGTNLVNGTGQSLAIEFSERSASQVTINSVDLRAGTSGLNLSILDDQQSVASRNSTASRANITSQGGRATYGSVSAVASEASVVSVASLGTSDSGVSVASIAAIESIASVASVASYAAVASVSAVNSATSVASQASRASTTIGGKTFASEAAVASRASRASVASAAGVASRASVEGRDSQAGKASRASLAQKLSGATYGTRASLGARTFSGIDSGAALTSAASRASAASITAVASAASHGNRGTYVAAGDTTTLNGVINELDGALIGLRTNAQTLGQNIALLNTRLEFTESYVNTLTEGSSKLTLSDINEEGANLLALQTRQQLGVQALSFAGQAEQSVLRLF